MGLTFSRRESLSEAPLFQNRDELVFTKSSQLDIISLDSLDLFKVGIMSMEWQLQEAKNRFSQLVNQAAQDGPQIITVRGKPAAILLSFEEYQHLTKPRIKLTEFFKESPLCDVELDMERSAELPREVEL